MRLKCPDDVGELKKETEKGNLVPSFIEKPNQDNSYTSQDSGEEKSGSTLGSIKVLKLWFIYSVLSWRCKLFIFMARTTNLEDLILEELRRIKKIFNLHFFFNLRHWKSLRTPFWSSMCLCYYNLICFRNEYWVFPLTGIFGPFSMPSFILFCHENHLKVRFNWKTKRKNSWKMVYLDIKYLLFAYILKSSFR